jgi:hypothetical protein
MPNDKSVCEEAYLKMIADNEKYSDGGPFNQSMDKVMDYLRVLEGDAREIIDHERVIEALKEFKVMRD